MHDGWACRHGSPASVLIVLMLSYVLLDLKDSVLSESTYMVVSTATLLLADFVYTRQLDESHPVRYGALLGMMLALTILTRITGIGLVGAFGVYELYRFRRIRLFAVVAGIVFAVFFVFYQLTLAGGGGYANHLAWKSQALVDNVVFYFKSPALLWGQLTVPFRYSLAVAFLVISGLGYFRRLLKHAGLSEFYVGLYMIPLLLFHNGATPRYCVPVYAFLLVYAAEELRFWITTYLPSAAPSHCMGKYWHPYICSKHLECRRAKKNTGAGWSGVERFSNSRQLDQTEHRGA